MKQEELIQKYKHGLEAVQDEFNKQWKIALDLPTYVECEAHIARYKAQLELASRRYRLVQPFKLKDLSDDGCLVTLKDFKQNADLGWFMDEDGFGHYSTEAAESDVTIYPSDVHEGQIRSDFSHVMWYNK